MNEYFLSSVMLDLSFVASVGQGYLAVPISSQLMQKTEEDRILVNIIYSYLPWLHDKKIKKNV